MIRYTTGDILQADAEAIVNTVNCVGVMGRGLAFQFKNAFPANFRAYAAACRRDEVQPGRMFVFATGDLTNPKYIVNFPTKRHWRGKSRIGDIDSGLVALAGEVRRLGIRSIALPPLGSGLGGLDWGDVRPRIAAALRDVPDLEVTVFEPDNAPVTIQRAGQRAGRARDVPRMTPGRAALVVLMHRYPGGLMDPFVTLLEVHKLMYFMQEAGEPLRLSYKKALYGPCGEKLRHVLHAVEGHLVSGYADGGDRPDKPLELVPGAVADAKSFLADRRDTAARLERVADLVEGFETPFGLELLATVHWVKAREQARDTAAAVYAWNDRKRRFSPRQIGIALRTLQDKGWLAGA